MIRGLEKIFMIAVIDYDAGNIKSLVNAIKKNDIACKVIKEPENIDIFSHFILPGVGSYPNAMEEIKKRSFDSYLKDIVKKNLPTMGICLGMQLFSNYGYEIVKTNGLSLIDGKVESIENLQPKKKIHVGWNNINIKKKNKLFLDINTECEFYFTHSYHYRCDNEENILCSSKFENIFTTGIINNNLIGLQFHPEKSHNQGLKIIKNFYNNFNA